MNFIKPLHKEQVYSQFDRTFNKLAAKHSDCPTQVRVFSRSLELDYTFPADSSHLPFHIASIGKVFTAVLIQILAARGLLSIDDLVSKHLPAEQLDRLFVYRQIDYRNQVTVRQLLGHTSGIADYFEGKTITGKNMLHNALAYPDTLWTPQMLVDFTRERQTAIAAPGTKYYYSDTGYILLGLLIEAVTGKSFGQNLEDEFFRPLEMRDTYLMFHTQPINSSREKIQPIWLGKKEVSSYRSLSCDWAGGGIVSTTEDLLKFDRALRENRLINPTVLAEMDVCPNRFLPGIHYGLGIMEIRFGEFFFLLNRLPRVKGHIGILATHMFYDPVNDTHIILNFGSTSRMRESFMSLIEIENLIKRII